MPFLNPDGSINVSQMLSDAAKGGGTPLPDGVYTCRLLSPGEVVDAKGEGNVPIPGKKKINAKFAILKGEHEKEELWVSYNLFNKSEKVGSTSGTVRLLTDLAAIGEPFQEGKGMKLVFDKDGNMALLTKNGPSVEALKKLWNDRVVGKIINIESKQESGEDKTGRKFGFSLRRFIGLANAAASIEEDELPEDVPEATDEEIPF